MADRHTERQTDYRKMQKRALHVSLLFQATQIYMARENLKELNQILSILLVTIIILLAINRNVRNVEISVPQVFAILLYNDNYKNHGVITKAF